MNWNIGLTVFFLGLTTVIAQINVTKINCPDSMCIDLHQCPHILKKIRENSDIEVSEKLRQSLECKEDKIIDYVCCVDLLPQTCGNQVRDNSNTTKLAEHPWVVLLEAFDERNELHLICGGSIINNRYILTAAHCVSRGDLSIDWKVKSVRLGEWDTNSPVDCQTFRGSLEESCAPPHISIDIEKIIVHKDYETSSKQHDIALLRLTRPFKFTKYIKSICLPENEKIPTGDFTIAGWGATENAIFSHKKLQAKVPWVDISTCNRIYNKDSPSRRLFDSQICAGGQQGNDTCEGDSGGPLMQELLWSDGISKWTLFGITSHGFRLCGQEGKPGVYTSVSHYKSWIIDNLEPEIFF